MHFSWNLIQGSILYIHGPILISGRSSSVDQSSETSQISELIGLMFIIKHDKSWLASLHTCRAFKITVQRIEGMGVHQNLLSPWHWLLNLIIVFVYLKDKIRTAEAN